ncbi:STAS domain-containing protein [Rhodococcus sp. 24CO]|uniref:STAS domain-containing protein n=1 Tax=Rhodococcus sp. 24CO TaxID=3117460 RepID=UPI003D3423EC
MIVSTKTSTATVTSFGRVPECSSDTPSEVPNRSDATFDLLPEIGGIAVLCARGKIDAVGYSALCAHLEDIVAEARNFVVDLTQSHFPAAGVPILNTLAARTKRLHITWALAADDPTLRVLEACRLDTAISTFSSLSDAVAFLSNTVVERTPA